MLRSSCSSSEQLAYPLLPSFTGDGHLPFGFGVMLPALIAFSVAVAFFLLHGQFSFITLIFLQRFHMLSGVEAIINAVIIIIFLSAQRSNRSDLP